MFEHPDLIVQKLMLTLRMKYLGFEQQAIADVLAAFVAILWCFERTFVKTAAGRFRLNMIGAIHISALQVGFSSGSR